MSPNQTTPEFWAKLDQLVQTSTVVIDRPSGSAHPRYPEMIYPLDYGYLSDTHSGDGAGIDVWVGAPTTSAPRVSALIVTVDLEKRDTEVKLLLDCTPDEAKRIYTLHTDGSQAASLYSRPDEQA